MDRATAELATALSSRYRLKAADATHLATAVGVGADRFITNNKRDFPPAITEIRVTYPADLAGAARGDPSTVGTTPGATATPPAPGYAGSRRGQTQPDRLETNASASVGLVVVGVVIPRFLMPRRFGGHRRTCLMRGGSGSRRWA